MKLFAISKGDSNKIMKKIKDQTLTGSFIAGLKSFNDQNLKHWTAQPVKIGTKILDVESMYLQKSTKKPARNTLEHRNASASLFRDVSSKSFGTLWEVFGKRLAEYITER